jgi:hypothetical protein
MSAATKTKVKKNLFRFYGMYNNINIGPNICLNGVKVILHEVMARNIDEAVELYKIHLINNCDILEENLEQYLVDLYYKSIMVEEIDLETSNHHEIPLI